MPLGCTTHDVTPDRLESVPDLAGLPVVGMCNSQFIVHAHRFRKVGCPLVWANCMTFLFEHEAVFCRARPGRRVRFQSEFQRESSNRNSWNWATARSGPPDSRRI